jgi:hypothetical protein
MNAPYQLQPIGKWTPEYLQELPPIELDWLDYKASAWLKVDDSITLDNLSKYLSAYSNLMAAISSSAQPILNRETRQN